MKTVKVVHFADLHYSAEHAQKALTALEEITVFCRRERPNVVLTAGDLFDHGVQNSDKGALPALVKAFRELLKVAPVVGVSGTPTHDLPGCYSVLETLRGGHNQLCMIGPARCITPINSEYAPSLFIAGLPEIERKWFLSGHDAMGAEDVAQRITEGVRKMLAGIGAVRREHPELPSVMLYHGQIAGARISEGRVLQPGGVQIGAEDLALAGADYYALGDIHLAQQIGDLPAHYSGSCFPVDWGELDQKAFNFVEFTEGIPHSWKMEMTRIPFSFAPRRKITVSPDGSVTKTDVCGSQVWLQFEGTKEEIRKFDSERTLQQIEKWGAVSGSRVTTRLLPEETVRAPEIVDAPTLAKKIAIYAESSSIKVDSGLAKLAGQLEAEVRKTNIISTSPRIRIRRLKLRGAIGIWRGRHVDEIDLDLDAYEPGLIALIGSNGHGKTTLLENLHPYPQMLTRKGTLQSHFRLRDSWRDLTFVNERSGHEYRALLQIDGANKSGAVVYQLYCDAKPLCNGRKEDYEQAIDKLFGPVALFLRSAFVAEKPTKNNPDLGSATAGEKKTLFRELDPRIGYLQACSDLAREHMKTVGTKVRADSIRVEALTMRAVEDTGLEPARDDLVSQCDGSRLCVGSLERTRDELRVKAEAVHTAREKQDAVIAQIATWDAEMETVVIENSKLTTRDIPALEETLSGSFDARTTVEQYEELLASHRLLEDEYRDFLEKCGKVDSVRQIQTREIAETTRWMDKGISEAKWQQGKLDAEIDVQHVRLAPLQAEEQKPIESTCPTCGQGLPADQKEKLKAKWLSNRETMLEMMDRLAELTNDQEKAADELTAALKRRAEYVEPRLKEFPPYDKTPLDTCKWKLDAIDINSARRILEESTTAQAQITEAQARVSELRRQRSELERKVTDATETLDMQLPRDDETAKTALRNAEADLRQAENELTSLKAQLKVAEERIEQSKIRAVELKTLDAALKLALSEENNWDALTEMCGPNGIQALELDALAPSIAEVANKILESAYGSQFTVRFRTTRMGGAGSNQHQIEDFRIMVETEGREDAQDLDTLSGGEGVWITKALYDAFGIVRARNSGTEFLTRSLDEADGKLESTQRMKYFRLLESAHAESGCRHTIVVTHSPEIQDAIRQHVVMSELADATKAQDVK